MASIFMLPSGNVLFSLSVIRENICAQKQNFLNLAFQILLMYRSRKKFIWTNVKTHMSGTIFTRFELPTSSILSANIISFHTHAVLSSVWLCTNSLFPQRRSSQRAWWIKYIGKRLILSGTCHPSVVSVVRQYSSFQLVMVVC